MSQLILVRHGQASFLEDDYDFLSDQGRFQAQRLGEYWARHRIQIDEVYSGPRRRHRKTAEIVGNAFLDALSNDSKLNSIAWPAVQIRDELDEHQVDQFVMCDPNQFGQDDPQLQQLRQAFASAEPALEKGRAFQRLFEAVAKRWIQRKNLGVESWDDFRKRVNRVFDEIVNQPARGRRVAVFTSVGPVAVGVQRALNCSDEIALETGWRIQNGSLTEICFSGDRFTLDRFNSLPHLDPRTWTYR